MPTATPVPVTATAPPAATGRYGGTLNLVSRENIAHQDVHQEVSPALSTWGPGLAYSRLMRFKTGPDVEFPSLAVECDLCERWTMEDDRTFVFELRHGVRWHDVPPVHGREFVADDIVFSYDRQSKRGWPNSGPLAAARQVEAPRSDLIRIELGAPDADFLIGLADGHSKIVPWEAAEITGDLRDGPTIGTGPWMLTSTRPDIRHTFEANPDYFGEGLPFVDKLVVHIITDRETREAAFRTSLVDVHQVGPRDWRHYLQRWSDMRFLMARETGMGLEVALNSSAPPFDNVGVRQAVFQAMDPWKAIEEVWLGAAYVSGGIPVARADWLLSEPELRRFLGRPDEARRLLQVAGTTLPVPAVIKVGDFGDDYLEHARRIAEEMEAVGFQPTLDVVSRRAFGREVWMEGDYQMFVGATPPVTAPNGYLIPVLHSQGRWNTASLRDPELDSLIERQAGEFDPIRRRELVRRIEAHVLEKAYRLMPAAPISIWAWWPRVRNLHPNFAGFEYSHWARVWLDD